MDKKYYERRLEFIVRLYREGEKMILAFGKEKIEKLVNEYRKIPQHDASLTGAVENFILDDI